MLKALKTPGRVVLKGTLSAEKRGSMVNDSPFLLIHKVTGGIHVLPFALCVIVTKKDV
jgi:hypothetical protein